MSLWNCSKRYIKGYILPLDTFLAPDTASEEIKYQREGSSWIMIEDTLKSGYKSRLDTLDSFHCRSDHVPTHSAAYKASFLTTTKACNIDILRHSVPQ